MTGVFTGYVVHAQIGEKIGAVKVRIIGRFAADFTAQTHIAFEQGRQNHFDVGMNRRLLRGREWNVGRDVKALGQCAGCFE